MVIIIFCRNSICSSLVSNNIYPKLMASLYQRLGGSKAVDVIIDKFYDYMLSDPDTRHFFSHIDIQKQRIRQKQFTIRLLGGPNNYLGKSMRKAHQKLKISKSDFNNFWNHTEHAMKFYKVQQGLINEVKKVIYSTQKDIVKDDSHNSKQANKPLFQRLGGQKAISSVVDKFYEFMLNDILTGSYFQKSDIKQLIQRQKNFIAKITGGPNSHQGYDMKKTHYEQNIGKKQFDQAWLNWQKALSLNNVNSVQINEFKKIMYSMQNQVEY